MTYFLIFLALAAAIFGYRFWSKRQARAKRLTSPLTDQQRAIIEAKVPLTRKLPVELRAGFEGKINDFLHQVEFVGCNGLDVTEEMRLSISAQACLLVTNSDMWWHDLSTVLIYESAFKSREKTQHGMIVTERETVRIGESWQSGPVILSWEHTEHGNSNDKDGHNVVLHEFAHQIDSLSGHTDGAPLLNPDQKFTDWARVFTKAYKSHLKNVERGRETVLDAYGAEGPEELFAVAVEAFFEKPAALKEEEQEIYEQLSELFRLDPVNWR